MGRLKEFYFEEINRRAELIDNDLEESYFDEPEDIEENVKPIKKSKKHGK
jgi:hypothetical protein